MRRAVSIHIGVNQPGGRACTRTVLQHSEDAAWKMAVLASQAGYESLQVLRGRAATRRAVHDALAGAAGQLEAGDNLLVTFSGHGAQDRVQGVNEARDEWWCLYDADLLDDKLAGYWRLFDPGVRIVVISESCFAGGMNRTGDGCYAEAAAADTAVRMRDGSMPAEPVRMRDGSLSMGAPGVRGGTDRGEDPRLAPAGMRGGYDPRSEVPRSRDGGSTAAPAPAAPMAGAAGSCIKEAARDALAIRAKVLLLTGSGLVLWTAARAAMSDTRQRITALALIYRALYQGPDLKRVDLRPFLEELTAQLINGEFQQAGSILGESQLARRTQHALRFDAAYLGNLDLDDGEHSPRADRHHV